MNKLSSIALCTALLSLAACDKQAADSAPPEDGNAAATPAGDETTADAPDAAATGDIVDVAASDASFSTLVTALKAADLVDALKADGPFTVFAPTDDAFAKLPAGTLDALLQDTDKLKQILTYHVVSGKVMASDVAGLTSADTLAGKPVKVDTSNGVKIGEANVVKADIVASNGVIHVIDTVLIPQ